MRGILPESLVGQKYGMLKVLKLLSYKSRGGGFYYDCKCDCGKNKKVQKSYLLNGRVKSCGCFRLKELQKNQIIRHGHSTRTKGMTPTYRSWADMVKRCTNPKNWAWKYYGGRGIKVCKKWVNSFDAFLKDMGERDKDLTLDRINNNGNYEKRNCRWATRAVQSQNRRKPIRKKV